MSYVTDGFRIRLLLISAPRPPAKLSHFVGRELFVGAKSFLMKLCSVAMEPLLCTLRAVIACTFELSDSFKSKSAVSAATIAAAFDVRKLTKCSNAALLSDKSMVMLVASAFNIFGLK